MVINLCFNYFNEKTCWTSQILGEYSWQLLFALMRRLKWLRRWRLPPEEKLIHNECQFFSRIFSKDFWSSASFLIEMVKTKIDHNKPNGNSFIIKNDIERSPCYPTALCKEIVQIFQKIVSKSCFNFTFLTILACQALLVDNKSTVQIWRNILESSEIYNFWWKFLPCLNVRISYYSARFA